MADECVIRTMTIDDYDEVFSLWSSIHGFGIRSIDDSREGVDRFLKRNPTTSVVALVNGIARCTYDTESRPVCLWPRWIPRWRARRRLMLRLRLLFLLRLLGRR